jgi:hypothetical protein
MTGEAFFFRASAGFCGLSVIGARSGEREAHSTRSSATLIAAFESRVWGSEPGRALSAAFNSSWL